MANEPTTPPKQSQDAAIWDELRRLSGARIGLQRAGASLATGPLLDFKLGAIFCAGNVLTAVACFAHANVRFNPPRWYSFFFTTIEHHSLHHSVLFEDTLCNYANSLILCDRLCGTFRDGEAELVGQDDRKRLSIKEQFLFPLRPMLARIKARQSQSASA